MKPLGKNDGGYFGETIDIRAVLKDMEAAASDYDWNREVFYETPEFEYQALHRRGGGAPVNGRPKNIYISTGIHGDEPAGPLAVLELLQKDQWPAGLNLWICPCLNPEGFVLNTRENKEKVDLNRDYPNPKTAEVKNHVAWLEKQPDFDLSLCLHEDWESKGFYILIREDKSPFAKEIIKEVKKVFPIDLSPMIENSPAEHGVVTVDLNVNKHLDCSETSFLVKNKDREHYTFESASDFPLLARVSALVTAVNAAIDFSCGRSWSTLELFEIITINQEKLQVWNESIKAFLAQERKEEKEKVTL